MKRAIYVNCKFLEQPITGVQRFAIEICLQLKKICPQIVFLAPQTVLHEAIAQQLAVTRIGKQKGLLWEQLELPRYLKQQASPILLNLCNRAPLLYSRNVDVLHDITFVRYPQSFSAQFRSCYALLIPFIIRRCLHLFTVSEFSKAEICEHYGIAADKIDVIYNAVDEKFQQPVISNKTGYLLAVSSDLYHKNFAAMIEAFLAADLPQIQLKIVGNKGKIAKQYLHQPGNRIQFLGRVSDDELISLYQHATAFIFPSLYEGFGIPALEAQACGCPVLASNSASMPEVLADSVLYFDPTDQAAMTRAMQQIVQQPALQQSLIAKGKQNVARFSWANSAQKMCTILANLT